MRLIDADALKEWIDEYVSVFKKSDNKDIKGYIEHQPTIEPKSGEWIEQEDCWQCSECGSEYVLEVDVKPIDEKMHYCPNCGARMKGADDDLL